MQRYRAAILEDDLESVDALAHLLGKCPSAACLCLEHVPTVDALEERLDGGDTLDILFADIELDGDATAGIEAVKRLLPRGSRTQVIYVTGHPEHCTQVYRTEHIYFLVKPVNIMDLEDAVTRAVRSLDEYKGKVLQVTAGSTVNTVRVADLLYIESIRRKLRYCTTRGVVEVYGALKDLEAKLPKNFYRCHKGFLVNFDHVASLRAGSAPMAVLSDGTEVPVGQRRYTETKRAFARYLAEGL